MTKKYFVRFLLLTTLLQSCGLGYFIKDDSVYYKHWNEASGTSSFLIDSADASSFSKFKISAYAKDKRHVYYDGKIVPFADPNSFTPLNKYYGKDSSFAFLMLKRINTKDINSFRPIKNEYWYSRDSKDFYFDTIPLNVIEIETLKLLKDGWAKDRLCYYKGANRNALKDNKTFRVLGASYAKDQHQVYYLNYTISQADPNSFQVIDLFYGKDKNSIFYKNDRLEVKDPSSFKLMSHGYSKDNYFVYYRYNIVIEADPQSFNVIDWKTAKDYKSLYRQGKMVLANDYTKDEFYVYYFDKIVEGADPKTFWVDAETNLGKDKSGCYNGRDKVSCP